jgi:hypothetical protein
VTPSDLAALARRYVCLARRYSDNAGWQPNSEGNLAISLGGFVVTVFQADGDGWGWVIRPRDHDEPLGPVVLQLDLPTEADARLAAWGELVRLMPFNPRLVETYLALALAGAKSDDPQLAELMDGMTNDEIERTKQAIGLELLLRQPIPPRPN